MSTLPSPRRDVAPAPAAVPEDLVLDALDHAAADPSDRDAQLRAVVAGWLASFPSASTRESYGRDLRGWATWCDRHDLHPLDATRYHVEVYARHLQARDLAPATIARRLSSLASLYRHLADAELVDRSPVTSVRRPRVDHDATSTAGLTRDEVRAFLVAAAAAGPRDHALAHLLALTGLRISEACGLDLEDLGTSRGHRTVQVRRKGGRPATVVLPPAAAAAVEEATADRTGGPLLRSNAGGRLTRRQGARIVARLARRAGIGHAVTPHVLRHAFITLALDAGVPMRDVQDAAGHLDPRSTRRYDRSRHSLDRHAAYAVAAFVALDDDTAAA